MRSHGNVNEAECEKFNKCDNKKFVMTCKFCCKNNNNGVHEAHENFTFFVSKPCMEFQYKNSLLLYQLKWIFPLKFFLLTLQEFFHKALLSKPRNFTWMCDFLFDEFSYSSKITSKSVHNIFYII